MHLKNSYLKISDSNSSHQKDKGYIICSKHSNCSLTIEFAILLAAPLTTHCQQAEGYMD